MNILTYLEWRKRRHSTCRLGRLSARLIFRLAGTLVLFLFLNLIRRRVFLLLLCQFGTEEENSVNYGGMFFKPLDNGARSQIPEYELCVIA